MARETNFLRRPHFAGSRTIQGVIYLKHYTGNPEDLSLIVDQGELHHSSDSGVLISLKIEFGIATTIELVPDGSNIPARRENRILYIRLVSHYRLCRQIKLQSKAFFEGLSEMIDAKRLRCAFP